MKKTYLSFAAAVCMGLGALATSCSESDTHSYMPLFEGFEAPQTASPCDSVTVFARQSKKGELIYHARYKWSYYYDYATQNGTGRVECDPTYQDVCYDVEPEYPQFRFYVPDSATSVVVTFVGDYQYSAQGDSRYDGSDTSSGTVANGNIRPVTSNVTGGQSKGSVRINIR